MQNWLISADSRRYDHESSFAKNGHIDWKQNRYTYEVNDIVYIYCTSPVKRIMFKTIVEKVKMPFSECTDDKEFWYNLDEYEQAKDGDYVRLKLVEQIDKKELSLENLKKHGLTAAPQGAVRLKDDLVDYIELCLNNEYIEGSILTEKLNENEIEQQFKNALTTIKEALNRAGTEINLEKYDGLIVKKLAKSNTLDPRGSTNQTHIAITGDQMNIFPYLTQDCYFNNPKTMTPLKKYFITKIPVYLSKSNINHLTEGQNTNLNDELISTHTSVVRNKRTNQADQIQVSILKHDGVEFLEFRKLLHENYFLIVLKIKEEFKYEMYGLANNIVDEQLSKLNNKFYFLTTETEISTETINTPHTSDLKNTNNIIGRNILLYGVPGSGKSWTIEHEYCNDESRMERVVFHPDYTYSDFVGHIVPDINAGDVKYKFNPGPFTLILKKAINNPNQEFFLIIEEINRGNAPAIFGDIFQLLDRKKEIDDSNHVLGESEYGITNSDIAQEVYEDKEHKVRIPYNLSIIGTMNTSDQNVFTIDTAFQRRWEMRMIENNFDNLDEKFEIKFKINYILDTHVTWEQFCMGINSIILEKNKFNTSSEDKRLGVYFIDSDDLTDVKKFSEKVLKYLWDDAFKFSREDIFNENINSLESLINIFSTELNDNKFNIFTQGVRDKLLNNDSDT